MIPASTWILFNALILIVLFLDLLVFHRKPHALSLKEAAIWSGVWIGIACLVAVDIYLQFGTEFAINFIAGYLIEKSLSIDNLFVFLLIFQSFNTPPFLQHKVLFWGILGAIVTRALFIFLGLAMIHLFHPVIYLFGLFLLYTGVRLMIKPKVPIDPQHNVLLRFIQRFIPLTPDYQGDRFWVRSNSSLYFTPLFLVLLTVEAADIVFAIDSIPAILAITSNPFIAYSSNMCAILGLRALYFLLASSLGRFRNLHYAISAILILIGIKMLLSDLWHPHPLVSLGVIVLILLIAILSPSPKEKN